MTALLDTIVANQIWQKTRDKTLDWLESALGGVYQNPQEARPDLSNLIALMGFEQTPAQAYGNSFLGLGPMPMQVWSYAKQNIEQGARTGLVNYMRSWKDYMSAKGEMTGLPRYTPGEMRSQLRQMALGSYPNLQEIRQGMKLFDEKFPEYQWMTQVPNDIHMNPLYEGKWSPGEYALGPGTRGAFFPREQLVHLYGGPQTPGQGLHALETLLHETSHVHERPGRVLYDALKSLRNSGVEQRVAQIPEYLPFANDTNFALYLTQPNEVLARGFSDAVIRRKIADLGLQEPFTYWTPQQRLIPKYYEPFFKDLALEMAK